MFRRLGTLVRKALALAEGLCTGRLKSSGVGLSLRCSC